MGRAADICSDRYRYNSKIKRVDFYTTVRHSCSYRLVKAGVSTGRENDKQVLTLTVTTTNVLRSEHDTPPVLTSGTAPSRTELNMPGSRSQSIHPFSGRVGSVISDSESQDCLRCLVLNLPEPVRTQENFVLVTWAVGFLKQYCAHGSYCCCKAT
ncbi:hypothetical protein RRG08_056209 [Elysia crispata]|uniref:Uncharacterized protein n=1 Tax=Elysia crispata TaxID=231223 RepID=A0AAE0YL86_9GAST|nr:hypothetical protein RRG08_056209 [Elysia crispata]